MTLQGRRKIFTQFTNEQLTDPNNLKSMFNAAMRIHDVNKVEIQYLLDYHNGRQPILDKVKVVREDVNNITVINNARMITRTIVGYFLGTPIQYIDSSGTNKDALELLNKYVGYENKPAVDSEVGENQSICGVGYRIILSDNDDDVPFEDRSLDPTSTFVIYGNTLNENPIAGVTYYPIYDEDGNSVGIKAFIYTSFGVYISENKTSTVLDENSPVSFQEYSVGGVPIIEYPNNSWRTGDWEHALDLMNDINSLQSGRMDDIDQIVQSLLVFTNADIDEDGYAEMREQGVVLLKNKTGDRSSVDVIKNPLDQGGIGQYAMELQELLYSLTGIPSRNSRSGGGGDTGQAVELRDGWADLEIVARRKESVYERSEKRTLKIILTILANKLSSKLVLRDIDIKFTRNKSNNLLVKTQSYQTLLSTKTLSPNDALTIVDLVSDVNDYITRGEEYYAKHPELLEVNTVNTPVV